MNGILSDWTRERYDADTERQRSTAMKAFLDPAGPRAYYLKHIDPPTKWGEPNDDYQPKVDHFVMGTLGHEAIIEGRINWIVSDHRRGTSEWKRTVRRNRPKWVISPSQGALLAGMIDGIDRNPEAREILEGGRFQEQVFLWDQDVDCGDFQAVVPCKAAVDILRFNAELACLKTTRAKDREEFEREIERLHYYYSAAFYLLGLSNIPQFADFQASFKWIVVSKIEPYNCWVFEASRAMIQLGLASVHKTLRRYARCRRDAANGVPALEAWPDDTDQSTPITPSMRIMERHGATE